MWTHFSASAPPPLTAQCPVLSSAQYWGMWCSRRCTSSRVLEAPDLAGAGGSEQDRCYLSQTLPYFLPLNLLCLEAGLCGAVAVLPAFSCLCGWVGIRHLSEGQDADR